MQIADTLRFLLGGWTLERDLTDHRAGVAGRFAGTAVVVAQGAAEARYVEEGRLRLAGHESAARRVLRYARTATGAVLVSFADGRPFLELNLRDGGCTAIHPCVADRYALEFTVTAPDVLVERWRVRGPAKDYDAVTTWRRES